MFKHSKTFAVKALALSAVLTLASAARAELVENPFFKSWASCKVGTSITMKMTASANMPMPDGPENQLVMRLLEVKGDEVVIEITSGGQDHSEKATIPAKCEKGEEFLSMMPQAERANIALKAHTEGKDKIDVNGKLTDVIVLNATAEQRPMPDMVMTMKYKLWVSPAHPGGFVKMEMTQDNPAVGANPPQPPVTITVTTIAWNDPDKAPAAGAATQPAASQPAAAAKATTRP